MGYAMNVKQIVDVSSGGASDVSYTPYPNFPPLLPYIKSLDDLVTKNRIGVFDPKASEQLMKDAGYERDSQHFWAKDGKRAGGDMHGISIVNQIGPLVQQQLRKGGFDVTFYSTPDSSRIMANGQCPLCLSGHSGSSIFDPLATLEAYPLEELRGDRIAVVLLRTPAQSGLRRRCRPDLYAQARRSWNRATGA